MPDLSHRDYVDNLLKRIAELEQALEDASAECTENHACMVKLDIASTLRKEIDK